MKFSEVFPLHIPIINKVGSAASIMCPLIVSITLGLLLFFLPWYLRLGAAFATFYSMKSISLTLSACWSRSARLQSRLYSTFVKDSAEESTPAQVLRILSRPISFHPQFLAAYSMAQLDRFIQWFAVVVGNTEYIRVGRIRTTRVTVSEPTCLDYRNSQIRENKAVKDQIEVSIAVLEFPHTATSIPILYAPEIVTTILPKVTMMSEADSSSQSQALSGRATNLMIESRYQAECSNGSGMVAHIIAVGRRIKQAHLATQLSLNSLGARSSRSTASVTGLLTTSPFLLSAGIVLTSSVTRHIMSTVLGSLLSAAWGLF